MEQLQLDTALPNTALHAALLTGRYASGGYGGCGREACQYAHNFELWL